MGSNDVISGLDETQVKLLQEECILINEQDEVTGSATKKECHLLENINKGMVDIKRFMVKFAFKVIVPVLPNRDDDNIQQLLVLNLIDRKQSIHLEFTTLQR